MIIDPDNCDLCCGNAYESYFWNEFGEICPDSKCLKSNYVKNGIVYERAFFRRDGGTSTAPVKNVSMVINGKLNPTDLFIHSDGSSNNININDGKGRRRLSTGTDQETAFLTGGITFDTASD
jgi:hypothetical protein